MRKLLHLLKKAHENFTLIIALIICALLNIIGVDIDPDNYEEKN